MNGIRDDHEWFVLTNRRAMESPPLEVTTPEALEAMGLRGVQIEHYRRAELLGMLRPMRFMPIDSAPWLDLARFIVAHEVLHTSWPGIDLATAAQDVVNAAGTCDRTGPEVAAAKDRFRTKVLELHGPTDAYSGPEVDAPMAAFTTPEPQLQFQKRKFIVTGRFRRCTRQLVRDLTRRLGGIIAERPTQDADYLIVGDLPNPAWSQTCRGRKIDEIEAWLRTGRTQCEIIREERWYDCALTAYAHRDDREAVAQPGREATEEESIHDG